MTTMQHHAGLAAIISGLLSACAAPAPSPPPPPAPNSVQLNPVDPTKGLGGSGVGTVFFDGTLYHFSISGLGVDGSAVAVMQTAGDVSHMTSIEQFPGVYRKIANGQAGNDLWTSNAKGVVLHLIAPAGSRMPRLENDGLQVRLNQ